MKTLTFIVDKQIIEPDPSCEEFEGLVPGTEGYLLAAFNFSRDWNGYSKVAAFYSMLGREYDPQVLIDGKYCLIPLEALRRRAFKVQIIGKKGETKLATNKLTVRQNGGKK